MKDIAFHITDIAENSLRAGADKIGIALRLDGSQLRLSISDNGSGMDAETLRRVIDPFYTTRTTRRAGLGLPFLIQNTEQCGGNTKICSTPGRGTQVVALFPIRHIDCPPVGDLGMTLGMLLVSNPGVEITVGFQCGEREFSISTAEILAALEGVPPGHPQVASMIAEIVGGGVDEVFSDALK